MLLDACFKKFSCHGSNVDTTFPAGCLAEMSATQRASPSGYTDVLYSAEISWSVSHWHRKKTTGGDFRFPRWGLQSVDQTAIAFHSGVNTNMHGLFFVVMLHWCPVSFWHHQLKLHLLYRQIILSFCQGHSHKSQCSVSALAVGESSVLTLWEIKIFSWELLHSNIFLHNFFLYSFMYPFVIKAKQSIP